MKAIPKLSACPPPEEIRQFLNEELETARSSILATHLENCLSCQGLCETLTSSPASSATKASGVRPESALADMMQQLQKRGPVKPEDADREEFRFPGPADEGAPLGRVGQYAILNRIAEGSQGVLFRARDETLNRIVAIKVLHPQLLQSASARSRFLREARMGAAVQNEHIVRVIQVENKSGFTPFLVMEYVVGESLRDKLHRTESVAVREAIRIVRETALGLQAAHQAGLIHRDIKPSNILLEQRSGRTLVTDFGLAIEDKAAVRMTQEGTLVGTPAYMSPEQISQPESVDARCDIYSLGVVLYELLTGEVPFRGTVRMTLLHIVHHEPRAPRDFNEAIPKDLETVCLKAMSKDPALRFQSADELVAELDRWLAGRLILARPVSRTERLWRWCRRNPIVSGLTASVLTLGVLLCIVMGLSARRLAESNRQTQQHADSAAKQRSAGLDTLDKLIFDLQKGFDSDEVDLDALQRQSVQIALDGLLKSHASAGDRIPQDLPTAEALRRMGEILSRTGDDAEALRCLLQAEEILRACLQRNSSDVPALRALVETLWAIDNQLQADDDASDADNPASAERIREAMRLARRRRLLDQTDAAGVMLVDALLYQARAEENLGNQDAAQSALNECRTLCVPLMEATSADDSIAARDTWLDASELVCRLLLSKGEISEARGMIEECMQKIRRFAEQEPDDLDLMLDQLLFQELQVYACELDESPDLEAASRRFGELVQDLNAEAKGDSSGCLAALEVLSSEVEVREQEDLSDSVIRLLEAGITLAQGHLQVDSSDDLVRTELAHNLSNLADTQLLLGEPPEVVLSSFEKSRAQFQILEQHSAMDEFDQQICISDLLTAAELTKKTGAGNWTALRDEAAKKFKDVDEDSAEMSENWVSEVHDRLSELSDK